ncbi:hypothetical protein [Enterococcus rotai]|uniref:hypothetical protein n=1 Tax=Enterococcus rotai TaxID=118060 RepID=UPI0032B458C5
MKFKCVESFEIDKYEDEDRDDEPIGTMTVEKNSLWEMRDNPGDYDVMLDDCADARWIGLSKEGFKDAFIRVEEK